MGRKFDSLWLHRENIVDDTHHRSLFMSKTFDSERLHWELINRRGDVFFRSLNCGPGSESFFIWSTCYCWYSINFCEWWRHQMETFSALLALCAGNSPVAGGFPSQRPVTRSCDAFFICAWTNGWANNRGASDLTRSLWRHLSWFIFYLIPHKVQDHDNTADDIFENIHPLIPFLLVL